MKPIVLDKYLLIIDHLVDSIFLATEKLRIEYPEYAHLKLILIAGNSSKYKQHRFKDKVTHILNCDFDNRESIAAVLSPYVDNIVAVVCRGDKQVQYLRRVIPMLPKKLLLASVEALETSTNKKLMRKVFTANHPQITPKYIQVSDASDASIRQVMQHMDFPVIIKPTQLASSLLIQSCADQDALTRDLQRTFASIAEIYKKEERMEQPQVIVEEYLQGDFYSIDAYVDADGVVACCPPIAYIPAKQIGIDDFFLYKRFLPTNLTPEQVTDANQATKQAILAIGLRNSTAHVEMVLTSRGWKIIELGPRVGRFRQDMYMYGYKIDHSYNDIKIHLGLPMNIPTQLVNYVAAYSIYPDREGELIELAGWEELMGNSLVVSKRLFAQPGDLCRPAKFGGHALAELIIACEDQQAFFDLVNYVETHVKAVLK